MIYHSKKACLAVLAGITLAIVVAGSISKLVPAANAAAQEKQGAVPMLAHNVYFKLHDSTPEARAKLVAACKKYLTDHPGTAFFACGTVADLDREVNDRDFDVGLHIIFKDRASHDAYQIAPRHLKFIEENKAGWKKVRVFDDDAEGAK
jgi:hypothetical protein